jgi:hypothetical protein
MKTLRTYFASLLLVLFCCYLSGISLFSHVHIVNGVSIVHSHLGGGSEHNHSESQFAVIDILSHFQSEAAADTDAVCTPFFITANLYTDYSAPEILSGCSSVLSLRGPPQC